MTWLIAIGSVAAYLAVGLFWARWLFGTWRAEHIDQSSRLARDQYPDYVRGDHQLGAFICGLGWPISLPGKFAMKFYENFLDSTPIKSQREIREEHSEMRQKIVQLEKELGIKEMNK